MPSEDDQGEGDAAIGDNRLPQYNHQQRLQSVMMEWAFYEWPSIPERRMLT